MEAKKSKPNWLWMVISFVALMALGALGYWFWNRSPSLTLQDWIGQWQIEYYYEHQPSLRYEGTLYLDGNDSLRGRLEVFAPKSNKPEVLSLEETEFSLKENKLQAELIHNSYKINGGYMREQLTLQLLARDTLIGAGRCLEFCAEGTEQVTIQWVGNKKLEN